MSGWPFGSLYSHIYFYGRMNIQKITSRIRDGLPALVAPQALLRVPTISQGNSILLLKNGGEFFPALVAAIDSATRCVHIETYIFRDDAAGQSIAHALKSAAQRGVSVRVVVDGVGRCDTPEAFFIELTAAGVELAIFRPEPRFFNFRTSRPCRIKNIKCKVGAII